MTHYLHARILLYVYFLNLAHFDHLALKNYQIHCLLFSGDIVVKYYIITY